MTADPAPPPHAVDRPDVPPIGQDRGVSPIAGRLGVPADDLMACMAWETGRTFNPAVRNMAGSGATGLIQFMPSTARALGTTTDALAAMSAERQLDYVEAYFQPYRGRLRDLGDLYMAILWPRGIGQPVGEGEIGIEAHGQSNRLDTLLSSAIRRTASPISGAMVR